jgi:hypothetical protein
MPPSSKPTRASSPRQSSAAKFSTVLALDIVEGPTRRSRDGMDEDIAAVTKTYTIEYRTAEDSLVSL